MSKNDNNTSPIVIFIIVVVVIMSLISEIFFFIIFSIGALILFIMSKVEGEKDKKRIKDKKASEEKVLQERLLKEMALKVSQNNINNLKKESGTKDLSELENELLNNIGDETK